jgi:NAD(P)H dehydrogenase (quinone)
MMQGKVLVTGATGRTGSETVKLLLGRGDSVRALAHRKDERADYLQDLGAEVIFGQVLDGWAIRQAMEGTRWAYFCYPVRPGLIQATANFVRAARATGLDGIVNMSQISARSDSPSQAAQSHWLSEQIFNASGIATAHIRPTFSAEWLLYLAPAIRSGRICGPWTSGKHAPICAYDQARVIVGILDNPKVHSGKVYPLFGAVEYTFPEIAGVLSRVLGKEVRYEYVDFDSYWKGVMAQARQVRAQPATASPYGKLEQSPDARGDSFLAQHLRQVITVDHRNGLFSGTNDYVETIGGKPPTTLERFIEQNREAFA